MTQIGKIVNNVDIRVSAHDQIKSQSIAKANS